jgi:hypothetical protein
MTDNWSLVWVSHHQLLVTDSDEIGIETADFSNGLIIIMGHGATIHTGIHTGNVRVQASSLPGPPPQPDPGPWEEIVEASVYSSTGHLGIDVHYPDPGYDTVRQFPDFATAGPGWYRLRAHAHGRDTPHDAAQEAPLEDYLLLCWPATHAPTDMIRTTDRCGQALRAQTARGTTPAPPQPSAAERAHEQLLRDNIHRRLSTRRQPD